MTETWLYPQSAEVYLQPPSMELGGFRHVPPSISVTLATNMHQHASFYICKQGELALARPFDPCTPPCSDWPIISCVGDMRKLGIITHVFATCSKDLMIFHKKLFEIIFFISIKVIICNFKLQFLIKWIRIVRLTSIAWIWLAIIFIIGVSKFLTFVFAFHGPSFVVVNVIRFIYICFI